MPSLTRDPEFRLKISASKLSINHSQSDILLSKLLTIMRRLNRQESRLDRGVQQPRCRSDPRRVRLGDPSRASSGFQPFSPSAWRIPVRALRESQLSEAISGSSGPGSSSFARGHHVHSFTASYVAPFQGGKKVRCERSATSHCGQQHRCTGRGDCRIGHRLAAALPRGAVLARRSAHRDSSRLDGAAYAASRRLRVQSLPSAKSEVIYRPC